MKALRYNRQAFNPFAIAIAGVAAAVVLVVLFASLGAASNPHRLANPDQCKPATTTFWQASGTYSVNGFGSPNGKISAVSVDKVPAPPSWTSLAFEKPNPATGNPGDDVADVWVEMSINGPGDVQIYKWASEKTRVDITLIQQFTSQSFPGQWKGPVVCFPQHGKTTWTFNLIWQDLPGALFFNTGGPPEVFDQQIRVVDV